MQSQQEQHQTIEIDGTECGDPGPRNQFWSACLPHKAITAKKHKLSPYHGSHCSQFHGGDEDCGDDDDGGSHFHNRNNLNRDELGGALRE